MKNVFRFWYFLTSLVVVSFLYTTPVSAETSFLAKINTFFPKENTTPHTLSQEDLVNLTKPSVVRIVQYSKGNLSIKTKIKLDLKNFKIETLPNPTPVVVPIEEYLTGSGFVVTPDGYIVTNSHVISNKVLVNSYLTKVAQAIVEGTMKTLSAADAKAFQQTNATPDGQAHFNQYIKDIAKAIEKETAISIQTQVTVLNPSFIGDTFEELLSEGFLAKVVYENPDFFDDQKDVALIKIDQDNLPALPFAHMSDTTVAVGQKVYVFGFPGNADVSAQIDSDFIQPTFSSGAISALKNSPNTDFKIIQTDAKISTGSSGSPILNDHGEVIGIVSMLMDTASTGDSFSFGVPLDVLNASIATTAVVPQTGSLFTHFTKGLDLFLDKHCDQAVAEFDLAKNGNKSFFIGTFVDTYSVKCQTMQNNGQSIDTDMEEFLIHIKKYQTVLVVSGIGFLVLLIFTIIVMSLVRKIRKDEEQLAVLSSQKSSSEPSKAELFSSASMTGRIQPTAATASLSALDQPRIVAAVNYIKDGQQKSTTPGAIVLGLRTNGYSDQEIQQAFLIINKKDF